MRRFVLLSSLIWAVSSQAEPPASDQGKWVDLTHELSSDSVFWPTAEPFELTIDSKGWTDEGYYYSAYRFRAAEHGGTHIDAPVHFAEGRESVDEISLTRLIGPAVVVDVSESVERASDYQIGVTDLTTWEQTHGRISEGAIVLLRTGYASHWRDAARYLGTAERGAKGAANLHFPGLHPDAASWLVERGIASVGIDTASIDFGPSKDFASHVTLMTENVPAFENLARLEELPAVGAYVVALPMKIKGGSGGPLRIVAWIPDSQ